MPIAAAYLRVSTEEQDEYSLDSQLKLIREYAEKNGYTVPDDCVYVDDGISGRTAAKRKAFQEMIAVAKDTECPFDTILLWKFSRFARNQEESIVYKAALRRLGINIVSISEPLPEGPFSSLIERIIEWMDEFYSIRLSGEVKRGMLEKASRGEPVAIAPFGYDMENNKYIPNADAQTVREVFESYASGDFMLQIARRLGEQGVRTRRGNLPDNRFVEYMLNNPVYIGKIRWSREGRAASKRDYENENIVVYDGNHEPIIDKELWDKVQKRIRDDSRKYARGARKNEPASFMLKGLVRCSSCGSTLCLLNGVCPSIQCHKYTHGQCSTSHALSLAKANKAVIKALEDAVASMSFNMVPEEAASPSSDDTAKLIAAAERKLLKVSAAYENGIDTLEEYAEKKRRLNEEIKKLRASQKKKPAPAFDIEAYAAKVSDVIGIIKSPEISEHAKNEALRSVLSHIIYRKSAQTLELYFYA